MIGEFSSQNVSMTLVLTTTSGCGSGGHCVAAVVGDEPVVAQALHSSTGRHSSKFLVNILRLLHRVKGLFRCLLVSLRGDFVGCSARRLRGGCIGLRRSGLLLFLCDSGIGLLLVDVDISPREQAATNSGDCRPCLTEQREDESHLMKPP